MEQTKWISVDERLPDLSSVYTQRPYRNFRVLASTNTKRVYETIYTSLGWANENGEKVTHWKPLPPAP